MKHVHMLMAVVVIALFIYQSYKTLSDQPLDNKGIKIATHIVYTLVIGSGAWMLYQLMSVNTPVQWAFAKILLLLAAISASVKAFNTQSTPAQRKIGIMIATIAYVGIVTLAFMKPADLF